MSLSRYLLKLMCKCQYELNIYFIEVLNTVWIIHQTFKNFPWQIHSFPTKKYYGVKSNIKN